MICNTDATSLIQGCTVYLSITKFITLQYWGWITSPYTPHSPPIQGPVIYAGGTLVMAPPLLDFTALLRPSKLPNRSWMEPNFCPLPDLKLSGRPMSVSAESIGVLEAVYAYISEKQHPKRCKLILFWDGQQLETLQLRTLCDHRTVIGRQSSSVVQ